MKRIDKLEAALRQIASVDTCPQGEYGDETSAVRDLAFKALATDPPEVEVADMNCTIGELLATHKLMNAAVTQLVGLEANDEPRYAIIALTEPDTIKRVQCLLKTAGGITIRGKEQLATRCYRP